MGTKRSGYGLVGCFCTIPPSIHVASFRESHREVAAARDAEDALPNEIAHELRAGNLLPMRGTDTELELFIRPPRVHVARVAQGERVRVAAGDVEDGCASRALAQTLEERRRLTRTEVTQPKLPFGATAPCVDLTVVSESARVCAAAGDLGRGGRG